jgi:hypothetical protein
MIVFSLGMAVLTAVIDNWETVKTRLLAIFEDIRQAAPTWLGGQGRGWGVIAGGPGVQGLRDDARRLAGSGLDSLGLGGLADYLFPNRREVLRIWGFNEAAIATLDRHRTDRALAAWEYHGPPTPHQDDARERLGVCLSRVHGAPSREGSFQARSPSPRATSTLR